MRSLERWAVNPARSRLMVAPLLVLLALALSPTYAGAGKPSSEIIYDPSIPNIQSEPPAVKAHPNTPMSHGPGPQTQIQKPTSSATEEDAETAPDPSGEPRSEGHHQGDRHQGHAAPPGKGGGDTPSDSGGSSEGTARSVAHSNPMPISIGASKKSDGGSSPVLALLIAVSVLAAVSIGFARYRMSKQVGPPGSQPGR